MNLCIYLPCFDNVIDFDCHHICMTLPYQLAYQLGSTFLITPATKQALSWIHDGWQVMENNPQLAHILNDPAIMQQTLEMMRNPNAMREMMRNQVIPLPYHIIPTYLLLPWTFLVYTNLTLTLTLEP